MIQAINPINSNNVNTQPSKKRVFFSAPVTMLPTGERNYCIFNQAKVDFLVSQKKNSLPYLKEVLKTSNDEKEIVEALYIVDRLIDNGTKGIPHMYPILARFNDSKSQNIQTFLAGIYRKTQVPDAFGPLVKMLIQNSINPSPPAPLPQGARVALVDANEEIGGAILEYMRNYSQGPKPIDFSA